MKIEEVIDSLLDQICDRESLIPKGEPDSIFAHDAEALWEAVEILREVEKEERQQQALEKIYNARMKKGREKARRNKARITGCKLHSFDCAGAVEREKRKQEEWGVSMPIPPIAIKCRCKNCGGVMSLVYAAPYMEALKHAREQEENDNG